MSGSAEDVAGVELTRLITSSGGKERPDLEFKLRLDVSSSSQKAELSKDVALQANLPAGGNVVYGVDDSGRVAGLDVPPDIGQIENVLANRLMFAPPGIDVKLASLSTPTKERGLVLWIKVPPSPWGPRTCFLAEDSSWKLPVRVGTVTRYVSPAEAMTLVESPTARGKPPDLGAFFPENYGGIPDSTAEVLESNLFPFLRLPQTVWCCAVDSAQMVSDLATSYHNTIPYALYNSEVYSLRVDQLCEQVFQDFMLGSPRIVPTELILARRDSRRQFIGLLNAEVEAFARSKGLQFDANKGRFFFPPGTNGPNLQDWTPFARKSRRTVAAARLGPSGVSYWYHLAARIRVLDLQTSFVLSLNPTWVFTKDGRHLLEGYRVGPIATRRTGLEDNSRFRYNTRFWSRFLCQKPNRIEIELRSGGIAIAGDPVWCRLNVGISGDRQSAADLEDLTEEEVPEPVPIADSSEGEGTRDGTES